MVSGWCFKNLKQPATIVSIFCKFHVYFKNLFRIIKIKSEYFQYFDKCHFYGLRGCWLVVASVWILLSWLSNTKQPIKESLLFQWFGNIVTMDWWDDLWLNEGFASFMEYLGANVTKPSWEMVWQYTYNERILLGYLYYF